MLSLCLLDSSVGLRIYVIRLSQISFFFFANTTIFIMPFLYLQIRTRRINRMNILKNIAMAAQQTYHVIIF